MSRSRPIIVISVIAILVWAMFAPPKPVRYFKTTVATLLSTPLEIIEDSFDYFEKISRLAYVDTEKNELKHEIAELRNKLVKREEILLENRRLRELLGFKKDLNRPSIAASVIGRDPNSWSSVVFIDKGAPDGVTMDMVVISGEGLVGRVRESGKVISKVMLINDIDSKVGAVIQHSREAGLLVGTPQGECKIVYLPLDSEVKAGDKVMTSGTGGVYPKGLLIGEVIKVEKERGGLYGSATVKPACRLSKLEEVLCIK